MKKLIFLFVIIIIAVVFASIITAMQGRFGIFIALTIIFPVIILTFVLSLIRKSRQNVKKLLNAGELAKAKILSVSDTGVTVNGNPRIALQLEVTPQTGPPFKVQIHKLISRIQPVLYQPGMILQVRYDPNNLKDVVIESSGENITENARSEHTSKQHNTEVKPLLCPSCGGQITMNSSLYKEKFITCNYCGTVIDLHE
ncbi:MAG: DUF3592 domain-containing protein [Bacteroidales bacterium]|jgi:DNA-directed RNA polymerase subunit RPC12/RpoP